VETTNRVFRDGDVARHAELVALSETQKLLGRTSLTDCALYSVVEPCLMCSFCIRETGIRRVVYSIGSPLMGGWSKWNVCHHLSYLPARRTYAPAFTLHKSGFRSHVGFMEPKYVEWETHPARWLPGEAWALMDDKWVRVDDADVGMNGRELSEEAFHDFFGRLTALPAIAFQARPEG
jgi:tRNA(Arg) A34 adenosine deaminase TadA